MKHPSRGKVIEKKKKTHKVTIIIHSNQSLEISNNKIKRKMVTAIELHMAKCTVYNSKKLKK